MTTTLLGSNFPTSKQPVATVLTVQQALPCGQDVFFNKSTMSASQPSSQDYKQAQGSKRKRSTQPNTVNPIPSTATASFISPNPFAVLSDSESESE
jgi:hypothetical protein